MLGADVRGGIFIGDTVSVGMMLQFHVRDELAAKEDVFSMLGRYKLSRQFSGRFTRDGVSRQDARGCVREQASALVPNQPHEHCLARRWHA